MHGVITVVATTTTLAPTYTTAMNSADPNGVDPFASGGGSSVGLIVGTVVGSVFLSLGVVALLLIHRSRRRERRPTTADEDITPAAVKRAATGGKAKAAGVLADPAASASHYDTIDNSESPNVAADQEIGDGVRLGSHGSSWMTSLPQVRAEDRRHSDLEGDFAPETTPAAVQPVL